MQTLLNLLLERRILLAVFTVVLGCVVTWGARYTSIDASFDSILSEDDPYREQVDQVIEDFPPSTSVLFAFQPIEGDVFSFDALRAMEELTDRYVEVDSAVSSGSLINQ